MTDSDSIETKYTVANFLLGLKRKEFSAFLLKILAEYELTSTEKYVLAVIETDADGACESSLVAAPRDDDYDDNAPICQYGNCNNCGSQLASWGKKVICPYCKGEAYCT